MKGRAVSSPILKIAKYTVADEIQQRSLVAMFIISAFFVFLVRSCYKGNYVVNGQQLDAATVAWQVSKAAFHFIAAGTMFVTALLAMRSFRRDRDNGMQACILSKPIDRRQYVLGKVLGLWSLSIFFMFILHGIIFIIASINMKSFLYSYLLASLLSSFNLLFVVLAVLFLSLLLTDVVAFLCAMGIIIVSWVVGLIYNLSQGQMFQALAHQSAGPWSSGLTWQKMVYYLWPKISDMQQWAASLLGGEGFPGRRYLYPLANVLVYCLLIAILLLRRFRKQDIV